MSNYRFSWSRNTISANIYTNFNFRTAIFNVAAMVTPFNMPTQTAEYNISNYRFSGSRNALREFSWSISIPGLDSLVILFK